MCIYTKIVEQRFAKSGMKEYSIYNILFLYVLLIRIIIVTIIIIIFRV